MRRANALGVSANRITLCGTPMATGSPQARWAFMENLSQPFGMALIGDTFYVGNTDGVVAFPYAAGIERITAAGRKLVTFKPGGHWTRSLLPSTDGTKLYAGVGSLTNIADEGMGAEEGRAAIYELDLASGSNRIFAGGLRNPVGLAWEPTTGTLWTVVNERDGLGDETPPDLFDVGAGRRILRLALLLLGPDRGRSGAAGRCDGRESHHAGLRARRPHRLARPVAGCRPARSRAFPTAW